MVSRRLAKKPSAIEFYPLVRPRNQFGQIRGLHLREPGVGDTSRDGRGRRSEDEKHAKRREIQGGFHYSLRAELFRFGQTNRQVASQA